VNTAIKLTATVMLTNILLGCAHGQELKQVPQANLSYDWHDGSKGGLFGIGEGWWINILHAEYETNTQMGYMSGRTQDLISLPAEYEWVRDESVGSQVEPEMAMQLITIPATYITVTETLVIEPAKTEYDLVRPVFSKDGKIETPARVEIIDTKAIIQQKDRRVVETPERTEARLMPVEHREGYRRVVSVPARTIVDENQPKLRTFKQTNTREVKPWRFVISHPVSRVSHTFDSYNDFKRFTDSLK